MNEQKPNPEVERLQPVVVNFLQSIPLQTSYARREIAELVRKIQSGELPLMEEVEIPEGQPPSN